MQGWNVGWEDEYAKLDELADPLFIEPKGYVFVGDSRRRMTIDNMPSPASVAEFGRRVAARLGMELLRERPDSRVCLLGEKDAPVKIPGLEWFLTQYI